MAKNNAGLATTVLIDGSAEELCKLTPEQIDEMFEAMLKAGANISYKAVLGRLPGGIARSNMRQRLKVSKAWTNAVGDVGIKYAFFGYYESRYGCGIAPLVANVFESGRVGKPFPKQPFMYRNSGASAVIKKMEQVQNKYLSKASA